MTDKTVTTRLRLEIGEYLANTRKAALATHEFSRELSGLGTTGRQDIERVGRGALLMAGGLAAGFGLAAKAAIDWESAWAGVNKTVDGSTAEMAALEDGLRGLATQLPATHGEIAAVAEAAGALGIKRQAIEGFTRTMIDLSETTNLTADQAATAMARMANIMQTPQAEIERMASTLVALGNAGASTEAEILEMATRIAAAGKQVGLSESDVLGFANALSSVGIEAEAGGSAISTVFSKIASAVAEGGDGLLGFSRVAGMSADEYATAFREDAAGATVTFIEGLNGITESGGNVFQVLDDLTLGDIRVRNALLSAAGAGDLFRESLDLGSQAWAENVALAEEAEKRYDTTAAKLEVARNQAVDLGIGLGETLLPAINGVVGGVDQMATGFGELPDFAKNAAGGIAGVTTAALGVVGVVGVIGPKVDALKKSLEGMGGLGTGLANNLGRMAGVLTVAGVGVAALSYFLGEQAKKQAAAKQSVDLYTQAILEQNGALDDNVNLSTASQLQDTEAGRIMREVGFDFAAAAEQIRSGNDAMGESFSANNSDVVSASANIDALRGNLEDGEVSMTAFIDELLRLNEAGKLTDEEVRIVANEISNLTGNYADAQEAAAINNAIMEETGAAADGTTPKLQAMAEGLSQTEEEAEAARSAFEDLMDSYRSAVDPLFAVLDSIDQNREAQQALNEAIYANADAVDDNNVSQEELNALYRDVASSALDVEVATRELAYAVQEGTVSVDTAKAMLAEWVAQGLITEEQAANVAYQFQVAADKASAFAGDYTANVSLTGAQQMFRELDELARKLNNIPGHVRVSVGGGGGIMLGAEAGGRVSATGMARPGPTDTIAMLAAPGEFMVNARAARAIGYDTLEAINNGQAGALFHGGTGGDSGGISRGGSTIVVQAPPVTIHLDGQVQALVDVVVDAIDDRRSTFGLGSVTRS